MSIRQHSVHGRIIVLVHVDEMAVTVKTLAGKAVAKDIVPSTYDGRDL